MSFVKQQLKSMINFNAKRQKINLYTYLIKTSKRQKKNRARASNAVTRARGDITVSMRKTHFLPIDQGYWRQLSTMRIYILFKSGVIITISFVVSQSLKIYSLMIKYHSEFWTRYYILRYRLNLSDWNDWTWSDDCFLIKSKWFDYP